MGLSGIKIVIWLMVLLTICCEFANPLRLLLLFLPIDWIHTIIFAAQNVNFAQELCQVDLRVFAHSGHVGVRRNYLANLPPGPLLLDSRGVPDVCISFELQEIAVACADCVGTTLLTICIGYILQPLALVVPRGWRDQEWLGPGNISRVKSPHLRRESGWGWRLRWCHRCRPSR